MRDRIDPSSVADPDIQFSGWGGVGWGLHGIKLNAEGTVGSFGGRKVIYNKIINHKI